MIILPKSGASTPITKPASYKAPVRDTASPSPAPENSFDQVTIKRDSSATDRFRREWVSRLVNEVRTSHTANDIQQIKSQVQSGTYQPDAKEIATKMLLEEQSRADI